MKKKNEDHLKFIRTRLPCCVCLDDVHVEAAHVRYSIYEDDKANPGMGAKPRGPNGEEWYVVPLCGECHRGPRGQHHYGDEFMWWRQRGIDPVKLGRQLWNVSGDAEAGERLIRRWGWA